MSLFTPKKHPYTDFFERERFLLAWRVSLLFTSVFLVVTVMYSFTSREAALASSAVAVVCSFCLFYLYLTKKYQPMFWVYVFAGTTLSHLAMHTVHNMTHYVDFIWMINTILLGFIGISRRIGFVFTGIHMILITIFFLFSLNNHIITLRPRTETEMIGELIEIAFAFTVMIYLTRQYILFQDYTRKQLEVAYKELASQNELIKSKNKENTLLIKEVHHRVKNNLQIITSLLRLQGNNLEPEVAQRFEEANNRIMSMALIHQKLYQQENFAEVNTTTYISELANYIIDTQQPDVLVNKNICSEIHGLGLNTIVPLGLLLNELISNSFKHGFETVKQGEITISIEPEIEKYFILNYNDNGVWKETRAPGSFGLELIDTLVEQLDGTFERIGSSYIFRLKNLDT